MYNMCIYILYAVLILLSVGKQQMHGPRVVITVSEEWQIIYLTVIAEALSATRIVLYNMYIGIAEWEIRLLCYDCGGLYGLVPRKHSVLHSWAGDGIKEEAMGWRSKEYKLATTTFSFGVLEIVVVGFNIYRTIDLRFYFHNLPVINRFKHII